MTSQDMQLKVVASPERRFSSWAGASVFASMVTHSLNQSDQNKDQAINDPYVSDKLTTSNGDSMNLVKMTQL